MVLLISALSIGILFLLQQFIVLRARSRDPFQPQPDLLTQSCTLFNFVYCRADFGKAEYLSCLGELVQNIVAASLQVLAMLLNNPKSLLDSLEFLSGHLEFPFDGLDFLSNSLQFPLTILSLLLCILHHFDDCSVKITERIRLLDVVIAVASLVGASLGGR